MMMLDHVNLTVDDLDATVDWYRRVFGFEKVEAGVRHGVPWAILKSGEALIAAYEERDRHVASDAEAERLHLHAFGHFGLRITDARAWEETVRRERVTVTHHTRYPHSTSWYVLDPSGWEIEVAHWDDGVVRFDPPAG